MGFSDYFIQTVTTDALPSTTSAAAAAVAAAESADADAKDAAAAAQKSDQEILESIEKCYYSADSNPELYELKVGNGTIQFLVKSNCPKLHRKSSALALTTS